MNHANESENDLSRFVSQPGEMELITPEEFLARLDRMTADALQHAQEQQALMKECDRIIEEMTRREKMAEAEIERLEREIEESKREFEKYGNKP